MAAVESDKKKESQNLALGIVFRNSISASLTIAQSCIPRALVTLAQWNGNHCVVFHSLKSGLREKSPGSFPEQWLLIKPTHSFETS